MNRAFRWLLWGLLGWTCASAVMRMLLIGDNPSDMDRLEIRFDLVWAAILWLALTQEHNDG